MTNFVLLISNNLDDNDKLLERQNTKVHSGRDKKPG